MGAVVELEYGNTVALEQSIDRAYVTTTSKLVDLMKNKFGLWDHLNAFKKYILLGQGDFIALLMESIGYLPPLFP
jgi:gamma-tubulin complex component 3